MTDALRALPTVTDIETDTLQAQTLSASSSHTTVTATVDNDATLTELTAVQDVLVERDHQAVTGELLHRDFPLHGVIQPAQLETLVALTNLHTFSYRSAPPIHPPETSRKPCLLRPHAV